MKRVSFAAILLGLAAAAAAEVAPPLQYFAGTYEVTGRQPGKNGQPVLNWLTLAVDGDRMVLEACDDTTGYLEPGTVTLDGIAVLEGRWGPMLLICDYKNDWNNYPRLSCFSQSDTSDVPGLLTLWPADWETPTHAAHCE